MKFYKLIAILLFILLGQTFSRASTIERREFYSPELNRNWHYTVYLPDDYGTSDKSYPVIYFLHGSNGDDEDWIYKGKVDYILDELIYSGEIEPVIGAMIDGNSSWYVNSKENIEDAFIKDFIPEIDNKYKTIREREGRVLVGFSMGGYGALRFSFKYPELFCAAGLLSPAVYVPEPPENSSARKSIAFGEPYDREKWKALNYPQYIETFIKKEITLPIYIVSDNDSYFHINWASELLYERLKNAGQPVEFYEKGYPHSWDFVFNSIRDVLKYVLKYSSGTRVKPLEGHFILEPTTANRNAIKQITAPKI